MCSRALAQGAAALRPSALVDGFAARGPRSRSQKKTESKPLSFVVCTTPDGPFFCMTIECFVCVCGAARRHPSRALLFPHFFLCYRLLFPVSFCLLFFFFSGRVFFWVISVLPSTRGRAKGKPGLERECFQNKKKKCSQQRVSAAFGPRRRFRPLPRVPRAAPLFSPNKNKKKKRVEKKRNVCGDWSAPPASRGFRLPNGQGATLSCVFFPFNLVQRARPRKAKAKRAVGRPQAHTRHPERTPAGRSRLRKKTICLKERREKIGDPCRW